MSTRSNAPASRPSDKKPAAPPPGFRHIPGYLDRPAQEALLAEIREVVRAAPLFQPRMPRTDKPLSVRMSNCGPLGWVADKAGYRYQPLHPVTGEPWPAIPQTLLDLWDEFSDYPAPPEACLVNFYEETTRMGLHRDEDEENFSAPVLSISLGDSCRFRIGGQARKDPSVSFKLASGDIVLLAGEARTAFHGVDRIYPGTSTLLKDGGRINLTLRRVTKAEGRGATRLPPHVQGPPTGGTFCQGLSSPRRRVPSNHRLQLLRKKAGGRGVLDPRLREDDNCADA